MSDVGHFRKSTPASARSALPPDSTPIAEIVNPGCSGPISANSELILAPVADAGVSAAIRRTTHRSVVASFQKRNRNPTVGAMLLRWRKPKANPPFTCVNMIPE
jgi:hypothetical protein